MTIEGAVRQLLRDLGETKPRLTVRVPPSDNRRLVPIGIPHPKGRINVRGKRYQVRLVPTKEAREYKQVYKQLRLIVPKPPVIVLYQAHFKDRRRDAANIQKVLVDALYEDDNGVYPWCIPGEPNKEKPHVDLWFVELQPPLEGAGFDATPTP